MQGDSWRAVLSYLLCKQGGCGCSQCPSSSGKSDQSCPLVRSDTVRTAWVDLVIPCLGRKAWMLWDAFGTQQPFPDPCEP